MRHSEQLKKKKRTLKILNKTLNFLKHAFQDFRNDVLSGNQCHYPVLSCQEKSPSETDLEDN